MAEIFCTARTLFQATDGHKIISNTFVCWCHRFHWDLLSGLYFSTNDPRNQIRQYTFVIFSWVMFFPFPNTQQTMQYDRSRRTLGNRRVVPYKLERRPADSGTARIFGDLSQVFSKNVQFLQLSELLDKCDASEHFTDMLSTFISEGLASEPGADPGFWSGGPSRVLTPRGA